ncbi:hypothetical protein ABH15_11010 [Methanoculleus taiwanensis]|uniref:Uncharacterized protein n=1 Tax=Methanoculleus taiwanensis TaxID=1550565 RepID=A0A498GXW6_9EURY|nr:hypothetical protein [Methanoculleus taiwanensis]RXE55298.1 hypothetical protein ABH15_11010 [Methanoculleus taiwanensis]
MEKQDLLYVVLAVGIVVIMALVVKPMVTGEPVNLFGTPEPEPTTAPTPVWTPAATVVPTTRAPTPTPTWNGVAKELGFVDPSTYQIDLTRETPGITAPPSGSMPNVTWVTYTTITGQWSGTTGIFHIPTPYWRLDYTRIVPMNEEFPRFNLQVMDADDPNRFVKVITLNRPDFIGYNTTNSTAYRQSQWNTKFYEGNRNYYFVINTLGITSYDLQVQVPESYV